MTTYPRKKWKEARTGKTYDRRIKLTDEDRTKIINLYKKENKGIREIARTYADKCSRRLIQLVIFPERATAIAQNAKNKEAWHIYYDTKKRRQYQRTHRTWIRTLLNNDLIKKNNTT